MDRAVYLRKLGLEGLRRRRRMALIAVPVLLGASALAIFGPRGTRPRAVATVEVPVGVTGEPVATSAATFESRVVADRVEPEIGVSRDGLSAGLDVDVVGDDEIVISYVGDHAGQARLVSDTVARTGLGVVLEAAGDRTRRAVDGSRRQVADLTAGIDAILASTGGMEPSVLRQAEDAELMALKREQAAARGRGDSVAATALDLRVARTQETVLDLEVLVARYEGLLAGQGDAAAALSDAEAQMRQATAALRPERLASATSVRNGGDVRRPLGLWRPLLALVAVLVALGLVALVLVMREPAPSPVLATVEAPIEAGQATVPAEPAPNQRTPISGRARAEPFPPLGGGQGAGATTEDRRRITDLARQMRGLRQATEILNAAEGFIAQELDLQHQEREGSSTRDSLVTRRAARGASQSPRS